VTLTPLLESRAVTPRAHPSAITRASTANIQRCVIADDVAGPGRPRARGNDELRAQTRDSAPGARCRRRSRGRSSSSLESISGRYRKPSNCFRGTACLRRMTFEFGP
jgi:hypothetical protein